MKAILRGARTGLALWLIGLLYLAPVLVMTVWTARTQGFRGVVSLLLAAILIACGVAAVTRTVRGFFLVQWPFALSSVVFSGYAVAFGMPPGRTLAHLVAGASLEEVRGLLGFAVGAWCATLVAAWGLAYLVLIALLPRRRIFDGRMQRITRMVVLALLPMSAYAAINPSQLIDGIALDPIVGSLMFVGGDIPRARAELRGASVVKVPYGATRTGSEEVHILVVGESARRESWSIYGYGRPTTPRLEALRGEMVILSNATADANLTDWAVPILLTGIAPDEFSATRIRGNVLDLAREGGYRTAWLVNQDIGISNSIGIAPDLLEYPPDLQANVNGRHALDEVLLPAFEREISRSGSARFIGLHMMGSHWEYFRRYPPQFQVFGSADDMHSMSTLTLLLDEKAAQSAVVDAYDNTVLYTDWFLAQLIHRAQRLEVPATLVFFPDHGEDLKLLDGATGHGGPVYTRHDFEIPAFVWANAAYRKLHPDKMAAIAANAAREIRSHNLFPTEADLMGIRWPGARAGSSFASAGFTPDSAMARVAGGVLIHPR